MHFNAKLATIMAVSTSLCTACAPGTDTEVVVEEERVADTQSALTYANGAHLNGVRVNGVRVNGVLLNGVRVNGVRVNGVRVNGAELTGVQVVGTTISGTKPGAGPISGTALAGATLEAVMSNGAILPLRIDGVAPANDPQILLYTVSYLNETGWQDLCGGTSGNPIQAMALAGRWNTAGTYVADTTMFTFACREAALAKCVEIGYKPWGTVQECKTANTCKTVQLATLHQACTRMIRADYCGDGVAHTFDGVPINLWDPFNIQTEAQVSQDWKLEAEWNASGAVCVKDLRHNAGSITSEYIDDHCPSKWSSTSFSCFSADSTFHTKKGYAPSGTRAVLRNSFDYYHVYNLTNGSD